MAAAPVQYRLTPSEPPQEGARPFAWHPVSAAAFYEQYHGHPEEMLPHVHQALRESGKRSMIFFAGDSSLDNKHWLWPGAKTEAALVDPREVARPRFTAPACNGYERVLAPPRMILDVSYWVNRLCSERAPWMACLNTAVEATTLGSRECCGLKDHDVFISENITQEDFLVVSVGGNDVALAPSVSTICNMLSLVCCTSRSCVEKQGCYCGGGWTCPGCTCCCWKAGSCGCGWPPGLGHFVLMFRWRIQAYIERIVGRLPRKPKKVLVCMIYFPDEEAGGSWADATLSALGYNTNPRKLQTIIRKVFELATSQIRLKGTEVVPVPLFHVLDGSDSRDYDNRVEPSAEGGAKMAEAILQAVLALPQNENPVTASAIGHHLYDPLATTSYSDSPQIPAADLCMDMLLAWVGSVMDLYWPRTTYGEGMNQES
uniref:Uncharacterized protein n=1 Tax=Chromera velia CCMP2878 TaxID=1169474 RepID=A0A0G4FG23_9ALVE|eukprot:Cvel_3298.t1-p1 / transcript=Cvel_3298.t1 / gene=Cvel_3298 / organism=Chromera_velia_CCMP2878 / gene_product=hypothetical protein / transcript_product=hypothetical protein / location=Cvel_scaffold130:97236-107683(+) / protein_length=428 / sequence_SO=supercontig / SO=protein_coding / is_pseudo=false